MHMYSDTIGDNSCKRWIGIVIKDTLRKYVCHGFIHTEAIKEKVGKGASQRR